MLNFQSSVKTQQSLQLSGNLKMGSICCGFPGRNDVILPLDKNPYSTSENSIQFKSVSNPISVTYEKLNAIKEGPQLDPGLTIGASVTDGLNLTENTQNTGGLENDNSRESAFLAPKSIPTLSKSSGSGKRIPRSPLFDALPPTESPPPIYPPLSKSPTSPRSPLNDATPKRQPRKPASDPRPLLLDTLFRPQRQKPSPVKPIPERTKKKKK